METVKADMVDELYDKLHKIMKENNIDNENKVLQAFEMAKKAHSGQKRISGEPFVIHPIEVAIILAKLRLDSSTIIAALLHDVIEDTEISERDIFLMFGEEILFLVEGVTKNNVVANDISKNKLKQENYIKILKAASKDIRVIIIKLVDRLHNMRTLEFQTKEKQKEIARETLEIYVPIAYKLGITVLSYELEKLCSKYLRKDEGRLVSEGDVEKRERERRIKIVDNIEKKLIQNGIVADISIESTSYKYMRNRMKQQDHKLNNIVIVVEKMEECYLVLGLVHQIYNPVPGSFKDYIATPKSNMYQSLHTSLIAENGKMFRVQIKTKEMCGIGKYGILKYLDKNSPGNIILRNNGQCEILMWLNKIVECTNDNEFIELLKKEFETYEKEIFCFSAKGDLKRFPKGATVIDFAYSIDCKTGNYINKVLVNGEDKSFDYVLNDGDQIEIVTSVNASGPNSKWLNHVKTSIAQNAIKKQLKIKDEKTSTN